jgi:ABC-type Fe3+/spermidine/putrescine transport system ATPase subunit
MGRVEDVIYQGEMLRVLVRLDSAERCTVALRNDGSLSRPLPWSRGAPVLVGWDPADARILEAQ